MNLFDRELEIMRSHGMPEKYIRNFAKRCSDEDKYDVSIIIPVYNGEKYIKECINSALNQTYERCEVIVVDDGSTDGTHKILKEIEGITHYIKPNGGTGSALNTGIKYARGEWIKWLSADDVLYPDAIEKMMNLKPQENIIHYTHYDYIDSNGNIIGHFEEPDRRGVPSDELKKYMMFNFFGNGSTSLIHNSVFKKIGMFEEMEHSEDYEFWLRCLSNGYRLELMDINTLKYRIHPGQLTNRVGGSLNDYIRGKYA